MELKPGTFLDNSIFWISVDKIKPNPYQPRKEFDPDALQSLADSIAQYGVLQALVVTRREETKPDGGMSTWYELIAGERRLRASRLAGIEQVPALIRTGPENDQMKLELAIIENLQREDLNPIDRARSFAQLAEKFELTKAEIGRRVGKSREYVSNSMRLLKLPEEIQQAILEKRINEGHARPLLTLNDKPEEQNTLYKEILYRHLTVRDAEKIVRTMARDKVRKKEYQLSSDFAGFEKSLSDALGTRVQIQQRGDKGGKLEIEFFSKDDLQAIIMAVNSSQIGKSGETIQERFAAEVEKNLDTKKESTYRESFNPEVIAEIADDSSSKQATVTDMNDDQIQNNDNPENEDESTENSADEALEETNHELVETESDDLGKDIEQAQFEDREEDDPKDEKNYYDGHPEEELTDVHNVDKKDSEEVSLSDLQEETPAGNAMSGSSEDSTVDADETLTSDVPAGNDKTKEESKSSDSDLYSVKDFSI